MAVSNPPLSCPHCGAEPGRIECGYAVIHAKGCFWVDHLKRQTIMGDSEVPAWNRRTPPAPCPTCAELRDCMESLLDAAGQPLHRDADRWQEAVEQAKRLLGRTVGRTA